jgi:Adenylate and Guanylate cyclase catalytic domain
MGSVDEVGHLGLELRVGINSGPVVAGVIGRKRFLYDLWGDAVNTASRMESHGTSGRIQITRATKELLGDEFVCEPRGTIPVKGKGEIEAWYLVGRRADPTDQAHALARGAGSGPHDHAAGRAGQAGVDRVVHVVEPESGTEQRAQLQPSGPDVLEQDRQRDSRVL